MSELTKEYDDFMVWFKENHPALHEKYGRNISIPFQLGGGVTVTPMYKISQYEQDRITRIAHTYYSKKDINEFDTIEFKYASEMRIDDAAEVAMRNNAIMWLSPIINQINRQSGKVIILFVKPGANAIGVHNVSDELKIEAKRLIESHDSPFRQ